MSWHYSRALVEEYLAASSWDGKPSAQWKSMPIAQAYLCSDRMTEFSRLSRFGMTFAPLTENLGEELLTWFLAGFPVNHSASQENKKDRLTKGNCSGTLFALWKKSDPNISFSKMCRGSKVHNPRLAYVGGLIDGEGCIRIQKQKNTYIPVVQITMSDKALGLLEEIKKEFGGRLYSQGYPNKKEWMSQTMWRINGEQAVIFLKMVEPYLMLKQKQCELAVSLHEMKQNQGWTKATRKLAARMKNQMHELNRRGATAQNVGDFYEPMPDLFGTWHRFSGPLPKWGLMRDGECWELPMSERPIYVRESGLLPTITATEGGFNKSPGGSPRPTLTTMARKNIWPTPHGFSKDGKSNGPSGNELGRAVNRFPTPLAGDGQKMGHGNLSHTVRLATPTVQDAHNNGGAAQHERNTKPLNAQIGGSLNPTWVEWLMGWPLGWTDLKPLETDKSHNAQQKLGGS